MLQKHICYLSCLLSMKLHSDLQTRKTTREDAWNVDGWAETVYNTGKWHITNDQR